MEVSNAMVRIYKELFGRGPTRARSNFADRDTLDCTPTSPSGNPLATTELRAMLLHGLAVGSRLAILEGGAHQRCWPLPFEPPPMPRIIIHTIAPIITMQ